MIVSSNLGHYQYLGFKVNAQPLARRYLRYFFRGGVAVVPASTIFSPLTAGYGSTVYSFLEISPT
jgi:hypothetical protein